MNSYKLFIKTIPVLYSHNHIHIHAETKSTIMMNEHTSLEKYTSCTLFEMVVKGLCVRGELETEQTATYWPPVPLSLTALLSCSAGLLDRGSWGPIALCWVLVLSTASYWLQLTEPVCRTGLYNCLTPICFSWASHLHPIQPVHSQGHTLISLIGCTCSPIDGWVKGQHVTPGLYSFLWNIWQSKWILLSISY